MGVHGVNARVITSRLACLDPIARSCPCVVSGTKPPCAATEQRVVERVTSLGMLFRRQHRGKGTPSDAWGPRGAPNPTGPISNALGLLSQLASH